MKYFVFLFLLLMSFPITAKSHRDCNLDTTLCNVRFNGLYDGDTIYVDVPRLHPLFKTKLGIRLKHINTPEIRGKSEYEKEMGRQAREFTRGLVQDAKKIDLVDCEKGKYFRLVCVVVADGVDVGCELLKNKYAVRYMSDDKYCKE